jgi:antitoxin HicB
MTEIQYPFLVRPLSLEEGKGFVIEFPDLPGCMSDGDTIEEAITNGKDAIEEWIEVSKKLGKEIPAPSKSVEQSSYSGKVLQRFPKSLHAKLAHRAKQEGVSLNSLIQTLVAEGLGYREATDKYSYQIAPDISQVTRSLAATYNRPYSCWHSSLLGNNLNIATSTSAANSGLVITAADYQDEPITQTVESPGFYAYIQQR